MSIDPNNTNDDEILVAKFNAQLAETTDAEQAIEAMTAPRVPSGGRTEDWVKPGLETAATVRDTIRRWTPAAAGTGIFLALLFAPLTGPLTVYTLGWALFGFWISLGRPGIRDTAALGARAAVTVWGWLAAAYHAAAHLLRRRESEPAQRPATA
ncbi:hypothetical protein AB0L82_43260 [Nocardia sp. NPDC052001]|uniref:hypothetical protein n=1 Tax=Nocardia sp. NPDC052001 TaxID=3154853 RepID=UPI0034142B46